jgi:hypothetical protein
LAPFWLLGKLFQANSKNFGQLTKLFKNRARWLYLAAAPEFFQLLGQSR